MGRRWGRATEAASRSIPVEEALTTPATGALKSPAELLYVERGQRVHIALSTDSPLPAVRESEAARDFRLQLQARYMLGQGRSKAEVAEALDKALGWVSQCQRLAVEEVPRPRDIPRYVADYNLRMLKLGIEPFRPAVLLRRYAQDTEGLYLECAQQMPWRQAVFRKRNYETGEVTVTNIASSRQDCNYRGLHTGIPRLDAVLDRLRRDLNIKDPHAFLLNNFYPDGNTSIAPHQHDFWSAILSLGASRVFTVNGDPVLVADGDVIVIGTQSHSVPKMPEVKDGRVSVAIFWYPENSGPAERCVECGRHEDLQPSTDGAAYCGDCWQRWQASREDMSVEDAEDADAAMLEAALQLSLLEQ